MNRSTIITAFFALVFFGGQCALAQSGYNLFQKGLIQERVKGDLDEAIKVYERIIVKFPNNRPIVAKALLHIGLCYEKMGKQEAQKTYRHLIQEYADQLEPVAQARARLSELGQPVSGMVVRRVAAGVNYGALSHDGKYLTYTDWDTGDVAVRELATGQGRRVTNKGSWKESKAYGWGPVFSPDDKQLAYTWQTEADQLQVRTINVDGSGLRILASKKWLELADWSPDGKHLLGFQIESRGGPYNLGLFSITDGSMRVFKTYQSRSWGTIRFSPDGRYIAYDLRQKDDPAQRDIFLISVDDGREIPLIEHPADDSLLGWAPDGKRLVFASDRTGLMGVWVINLVDGQREGVPKLLKTQMGKFTPLGMDRDGSYYFGLDSGAKQSFYTATLDPETGKVLKPPVEIIKPSDGTIHMPEWSPDGKQLAYLVWDKDRDRRRLVIHSLTTGASREIVPKPQFKSFNIGSLRWSPDGRFLLGWGQLEKEWAVLQIDVHSGEVSSIKEGGFWGPKWSPDGKAIYFAGPPAGTKGRMFFRKDLETGKVTEMFEPPPAFYYWTLSPDGKQIAYADSEAGAIKVIPITGGEPRVVAKVKGEGYIAWSRDVRYLLYVRKGQLWYVAVEGGQPEKLDIAMPRMTHLRVHPDGRQIVFTGQIHPGKSEVWVMENFLPESTAGK